MTYSKSPELPLYLRETNPPIGASKSLFGGRVGRGNLIYIGCPAARDAAEKAARAIADAYWGNGIRDKSGFGEKHYIDIMIGDDGSIDITRNGDQTFEEQTRAQGFVLGMLMGIARAKGKVAALSDPYIDEKLRPARRKMALKFESLGELIECANALLTFRLPNSCQERAVSTRPRGT